MPSRRTKASDSAPHSAPEGIVATVEVKPQIAEGKSEHEAGRNSDPKAVRTGSSRIDEAVMTRALQAVESILFSLERPVPAARLAEVVFHPTRAAKKAEAAEDGDAEMESPKATAHEIGVVEEAVATLNRTYGETGRTFRIENVSGGYRVMTQPQFAEHVALFRRSRANSKLSKAALETLAIIAYRQPITRAELEAIRGVACGEVLRSLMDRRLVTITGRAEELGRPLLYGSTKGFLDHFGLASIKDLPEPSELRPAL
jgi:segregation and condensation protein B